MIDRENLLKNIIVLFAVLSFAAPIFSAPGEVHAENFTHQYTLGNGSTVTIYTPEMILSEMTSRDESGNLVFYPAGGGHYHLIEDVSSPLIVNKGAGEFFPMSEEEVVGALREIDVEGRHLVMDLDIYILPMPRLNYMSSTSIGSRIFLSPGVWEITAATVASVVTHEFGHCYQNRYMPYYDGAVWDVYLGLRGILDDPRYTESAIHMNRPSEIFAEDFRVLFGGELAVNSDMIENPNLAHPSEVEGLELFMAALSGESVAQATPAGGKLISSVGNYPNPFNPVTTIRVEFSSDLAAGEASVRIYSADGSLVKDLWSGTISQGSFERTWDGMNDEGMKVASGLYFYRVTAGSDSRTGKMLLVR
jgi:hypothetical protein